MWKDAYQVTRYPSRVMDGTHVHGDVANEDPLAEIQERVKYKAQYRAEEQGVFHTLLNHGLKLRNNGAAELFVDQDNGIRLDPNTQSINMFANHYKQNLHDATSWLTGSETHYIGEDLLIKTKGKQVMISDGDIEITTSGNRVITIGKDDTIKVNGSVTIDVSQDVNVNAESITLNATSKLTVKAPSYDVPWKK